MSRKPHLLALAIVLLAAPAFAKDKEEKKEDKKEEKRSKTEKRERSDKDDRDDKSDREKSAQPAAAPAPTATGYDEFRHVRGRNIFDPSRRGMRTETPTAPTTTSSGSTRGRSLSLTGTMVTEGKALAFFGGSAAEGNRVIAAGSSVAGYKVTAVAPTQVSLERDGKTIALNVGRQLTFDSGSSEPGAVPGPVVEVVAPPAAEAPGVQSLPGISGDKAEILKRMMERRAQEVGK